MRGRMIPRIFTDTTMRAMNEAQRVGGRGGGSSGRRWFKYLNNIKTMNQKLVIYIILSAILLYLYYRRRDLSIFVGFVVVVSATLIFRDRNHDVHEGFGLDSERVGDNPCTEMGFTKIKLDKDDLPGSLEKVYKTIDKTAKKHWPYYDTEDEDKKNELQSFYKEVMKLYEKLDKEEKTALSEFFGYSQDFYSKNAMDAILKLSPQTLSKQISGGEKMIEFSKTIEKSNKISSNVKKTFKYLKCLSNYWLTLYKEVKKTKSEDKKNKTKKDADADANADE